MRVAVMGAGAVGCYYGARLREAGHDVVLIGRPALVEAIRARGLRLTSGGQERSIAIEASAEPSAVAGADVVLFCVKSGDTAATGAAIAPFLAAESTVVCLQNGVDNAPRLSAAIGRPAVPAAVYVALAMSDAGHVVHHGRGELIIGPSAGSTVLAAAFVAAGVPTQVTAAVVDALWTKLAINCAYNALSALTQLPYGELIRQSGIEATMRGLVEECRQAAAAVGVALSPGLWDEVVAISRSMAGQRSSTAQDLARGRRSEIDYINGQVVRIGDAHGIADPHYLAVDVV
ncbi:2-dehydropantoate 2-reductase, partial [bacterium]